MEQEKNERDLAESDRVEREKQRKLESEDQRLNAERVEK